jgi:hypothetical protein
LILGGLLLVFPSLIEAFAERLIGRDIQYTATVGIVIGLGVLAMQWLRMRSEDLRKFAEDCHEMGCATNNPEWHSLAERWLRCAATMERETTAAKEVTARSIRNRKIKQFRKAA